MKIQFDADKCSGLGLCEAVAPDVFEVQADGHLRLLVAEVDDSRRDEMQEACDACPTMALSLGA